jgi:hypothetical protein
LLTKAPTVRPDELLPWLKTVVKHEAFAVRKSSGRATPARDAGYDEPDVVAWTDERAERYERLRLGAEAISNLKPQEIRCLLLKAEGLSYKEICEATGWTYTKVNRSITEGRRAFLQRVARIESGAECEQIAPLISKVADGEATPEEMRRARPHLKSCLACKATLREYRATPSRIAGLVPPVVALAGGGGGGAGFIGRALGALQERLAGVAEIASTQKAAAVAASAVVLAGGGAAGVGAMHHDAPRIAPAAFRAQPVSAAAASENASTTVAQPTGSGGTASRARAAVRHWETPRVKRGAASTAAPEFDPGTAPASAPPASADQAQASPAAGGTGEFAP